MTDKGKICVLGRDKEREWVRANSRLLHVGCSQKRARSTEVQVDQLCGALLFLSSNFLPLFKWRSFFNIVFKLLICSSSYIVFYLFIHVHCLYTAQASLCSWEACFQFKFLCVTLLAGVFYYSTRLTKTLSVNSLNDK